MEGLELLSAPFANVQKRKGPGGRMLDYITARQVMDRLDEAVGPQNWQRRHVDIGGTMVCEIGIFDGDSQWIWKADGADESDIEGTKGALSDSFKRAAVSWGVGRYLYPDAEQPHQQGASHKYEAKKDAEYATGPQHKEYKKLITQFPAAYQEQMNEWLGQSPTQGHIKEAIAAMELVNAAKDLADSGG